MAMPDIHWGYGFCIGGVAATDPAEGGVISPGGVGYDINCGVRLIRTNLFLREIKPHLRPLIKELFHTVPAGVGRSGKYKFNDDRNEAACWSEGASYVVGRGLGVPRDLAHMEANGRIDGADPGRSLRPCGQARLRAVRHARLAATTSWKCRSSIICSMPTSALRSASKRT